LIEKKPRSATIVAKTDTQFAILG